VRAVQTGEILAGDGRFDGPVEVHSPLAGGTTAGALAVLDHVGDDAVVFLVGHEPLIRSMAARLVGFDRFPPFRTAGACLVSWSDGRGAFQWMLDPRSLTRIETVDDVT
jgi:phosphohistidine phosphatase SixA